jgi:hypothetical protein
VLLMYLLPLPLHPLPQSQHSGVQSLFQAPARIAPLWHLLKEHPLQTQ